MDNEQIDIAFGIGSWGAVLSAMAALVGVIVQNAVTFLKLRADIDHQRRLDELELAKLRAQVEADQDEH